MTEVLIIAIMAVILQYIDVSDQCVVHLPIQCYMSSVLQLKIKWVKLLSGSVASGSLRSLAQGEVMSRAARN